jgi:hypothetical protein
VKRGSRVGLSHSGQYSARGSGSGLTFWYQSLGCYSGDRNECKVLKCGSE